MNRLVVRRSLAALVLPLALAAGCCLALAGGASAQAPSFKTFPSAAAAADAFVDAVRHDDRNALLAMLGSDWTVFVPTLKDDTDHHRERFLAAWDESHKIVQQSEDKAMVEVGTTGFTMPMPIVKVPDGWRFDVAAGTREIKARHIGHNELVVVQTMLAIVDAQHEYAMLDPMKTGLHAYAARIMSRSGKKDGLYWPAKPGEPRSPLGSLLAKAEVAPSGESKPQAFYGYHFRMLHGQGPSAPGGAYDYDARGALIGGFAAIAWPRQYGETGVMTFMVSFSGEVYEKDLGPRTDELARAITVFDPESGWQKSDLTP